MDPSVERTRRREAGAGRRGTRGKNKVEPSAADAILAALRRRIIGGSLAANATIVEAQVGAEFGVSKTPAREALLRLSEQGLVSAIPGRGYAVTELSWKQIKDLFELRLILECAAIELATARAGAGDVTALRAHAVRPRLHRLGIEQLLDYNLAFHQLIWSAARNERLVRQLCDVMHDLMRAMHKAMLSEDTQEMVAQHLQLADLIAARDAGTARKAMEQHVDATRRRLLDL